VPQGEGASKQANNANSLVDHANSQNTPFKFLYSSYALVRSTINGLTQAQMLECVSGYEYAMRKVLA
jgi:hypothetical protein